MFFDCTLHSYAKHIKEGSAGVVLRFYKNLKSKEGQEEVFYEVQKVNACKITPKEKFSIGPKSLHLWTTDPGHVIPTYFFFKFIPFFYKYSLEGKSSRCVFYSTETDFCYLCRTDSPQKHVSIVLKFFNCACSRILNARQTCKALKCLSFCHWRYIKAYLPFDPLPPSRLKVLHIPFLKLFINRFNWCFN